MHGTNLTLENTASIAVLLDEKFRDGDPTFLTGIPVGDHPRQFLWDTLNKILIIRTNQVEVFTIPQFQGNDRALSGRLSLNDIVLDMYLTKDL